MKSIILGALGFALVALFFLGCASQGKPDKANRPDKVAAAKATASREWAERGHNAMPAYYEKHLQQKIDSLSPLLIPKSKNQDLVIFFTDYHIEENQGNSVPLIKAITEKLPVETVVFGGDIYNWGPKPEEALEKIKAFRERFAFLGSKLQQITGNHEYNMAGRRDDKKQEYALSDATLGKLFRDQQSAVCPRPSAYGDYWLDKPEKRIRYFFLGTNRNASVRDKQYKWLFEELEAVPEGYSILLFSHVALNLTETKEKFEEGFKDVSEALGALKQGENFTWKDKKYNFAGKNVDVVGWIAGHVHRDALKTSKKNLKIVTVATDTLRPNKEGQYLHRKANSITEQAFDIILIDKLKHKVELVRIGFGENRSFKY